MYHLKLERHILAYIANTLLSFINCLYTSFSTASSITSMMASVFDVMLQSSPDVLDTVERTLKITLCSLLPSSGNMLFGQDDDEDAEIPVYPCVNKNNFHVVHSSWCFFLFQKNIKDKCNFTKVVFKNN